jgi:hypothetical protein
LNIGPRVIGQLYRPVAGEFVLSIIESIPICIAMGDSKECAESLDSSLEERN